MVVMSLLYIFIMGVLRLLKNSAASPDEAEGVPIGLLLFTNFLLYEIKLLQSEHKRHFVSASHVATFLLGWLPAWHQMQDA